MRYIQQMMIDKAEMRSARNEVAHRLFFPATQDTREALVEMLNMFTASIKNIDAKMRRLRNSIIYVDINATLRDNAAQPKGGHDGQVDES